MRAGVLALILNMSVVASAMAFTGNISPSPWQRILPASPTAEHEISKEELGIRNQISFARMINDQESLWSAYDDLAEFCNSQHRYQEAQQAYQSAIQVLQSADGDHAIKLGCEYGKLASVHAQECNFDLAESYEEKKALHEPRH
jgi:tetratricopeptide (TPR) repeat protein